MRFSLKSEWFRPCTLRSYRFRVDREPLAMWFCHVPGLKAIAGLQDYHIAFPVNPFTTVVEILFFMLKSLINTLDGGI